MIQSSRYICTGRYTMRRPIDIPYQRPWPMVVADKLLSSACSTVYRGAKVRADNAAAHISYKRFQVFTLSQ